MIILVDQDGVLADFAAAERTALGLHYPDAPPRLPGLTPTFKLAPQYPPEWRERLRQLHHVPGFVRGLPPVPGALEGIRGLADAGHDVRICTAPQRQFHNCVLEKYEWIDEHLGADWVDRTILTRDKTLVRGDVLLDDKPHVFGSCTPMWTHLRFAAPYNEWLSPRVDWTTALPTVQRLAARWDRQPA